MNHLLKTTFVLGILSLTALDGFAQDDPQPESSIKDLEFLIGTWDVREDNDEKTWWEEATRTVTYALDSTYIRLEAKAISSSGKKRTYQWLIHYNSKQQQFEMVSMFSNWHKIQLDILSWDQHTRTLTIVNKADYEEFPERFGQLVFAEDYRSYEWKGENKYGDVDNPSIWRYVEKGKKHHQ